ncbi:MAG: hypothetical protein KJ666_19075 [Bacteroidetes bacterium]|nr:hypothetical protein [Bacteroidota bacterium]
MQSEDGNNFAVVILTAKFAVLGFPFRAVPGFKIGAGALFISYFVSHGCGFLTAIVAITDGDTGFIGRALVAAI